ncbi:UDP-2,3-diacylglucosamine diphosphatase LpxI [uncultured Tateyamaria sp.]|uniref:UDP-2,3-diacylglucosamine diphosphatase LpxI domain-containing protein n=1 Tax=uncultured Tateyamaria sp. TaxID=455651 RepID=UPI002636CE45|nr:UDP-2,3-diacylglucosamine diphosphatase LpxI [uncultured Tateyamaria sp.]
MLALIVGRGALPAAVAAAQDDMPLICALKGNTPDNLDVDVTFRIEHLGSFLVTLGAHGVTEVCFCGAIDRPVIDPDQLDADTQPLVPILTSAVSGGEDSALRAVLGIFEQTGFAVRGAHDLAPDLLPPTGTLTKAMAPMDVIASLPQAEAVLHAQGQADQGQACILRAGDVIAREDGRGTDAMLGDLTEPYSGTGAVSDPVEFVFDMVGDALDAAADWLSGPVAEQRTRAKGGYLFKGPKPGQDMRVDLPTIGPSTAMRAAEAGLDGIVIAGGGVMVLDQPQVVRILDAMGMFLWVR